MSGIENHDENSRTMPPPLNEAIYVSLEKVGPPLLDNVRTFKGTLRDLADQNTQPVRVLINNCDETLLSFLRPLLAVSTESSEPFDSAAMRISLHLVDQGIDATIAQTISELVVAGIREYVDGGTGSFVSSIHDEENLGESWLSDSSFYAPPIDSHNKTISIIPKREPYETETVSVDHSETLPKPIPEKPHSRTTSTARTPGKTVPTWIGIALVAVVASITVAIGYFLINGRTVSNETVGSDSSDAEQTTDSTQTEDDSTQTESDVTTEETSDVVEKEGGGNEPSETNISSTPVFTRAFASSEYPTSKYFTYGAYNVLDGDIIDHVWCENAEGDGVGEWVQIEADSPQYVEGVEIMNGWPTSTSNRYYKNNRVKGATLSFSDGTKEYVTLGDNMGEWQAVYFADPHTTSYIRITIESVYPGSECTDTIIAEVKAF